MKKFVQEFKEFALKGNMMDLAIGMIIGSAFTGIVNSLVNDIINPILGIFTGKIDFSGKDTEDRIDDVIYQGIYDAGKCTSDDHTYGKIHHIAF